MADSKAYEAGESDPANVNLEMNGQQYGSTQGSEQPPAYTSASGNLPTYQDAERQAPPPTYDSIYGKVKGMKEQSSGNIDFCTKVAIFIFGTIGFTIFLGLLLAVPISMIIMGSIHLKDCPAEKYIPIYLVVFGSVGVARNLFTLVRRCVQKKPEEGAEPEKPKPNPFESLLDTFMFAWFIAGNVWIYRTKGDFNSDQTSDQYCDSTLYWYAFWMTTSVYIMIGAACLCCCFCCICICCTAAKNKGQQ